jgi:hypothetical protein
VAPLVAAVLGIAGGVATALVVPADDDVSTSSFNDPLHLGVALVDQECSGEALLVLGYGDSVAPLGSAVANAGKDGVRYLRTDASCPTVLGPEDKPAPAYVVYRGPYESRRDPCETRMSGEAAGSFVTVLRSGNEQLVKCPCELPSTAGPELFVGMPVDQETVVWTRSLQAMLNDHDAKAFPRTAITGDYDQRTADRVAELQEDAPGKLTTRGRVDATTWGIITDRICRGYDY